MKNRAFDHSKYQNWIDPHDCKPYERNAKLHDEAQIKAIANSIRRFGWQQDVVITADNVLVIGHGRRLAALELGCEMPYHRVGKNADELTENDIKALRLADNKVAEGGFDFGKLQLELKALKDFDMGDFGFGMSADALQPVEEMPDAPDYGDDGFEDYQEPLTREELDAYAANAEEYLEKRRVIITYKPEQEEELKRLLGITEEKLRVVYDLDTILEGE